MFGLVLGVLSPFLHCLGSARNVLSEASGEKTEDRVNVLVLAPTAVNA